MKDIIVDIAGCDAELANQIDCLILEDYLIFNNILHYKYIIQSNYKLIYYHFVMIYFQNYRWIALIEEIKLHAIHLLKSLCLMSSQKEYSFITI